MGDFLQNICLFRDIVFGIVLWILLSPAIFSIWIPLYIFRKLHHALARILRPDLIPIDKIEDSFFSCTPSTLNSVLNECQVWRLKGKLDVAAFRRHFHQTFLSTPDLIERYKNFYCYFVKWGVYCFKVAKQSIDLEKNIVEYDGAPFESEMEQTKFIGKFISTNDYGEGPHWKILVINSSYKDESTMLFKLDHRISDGYSQVHTVSMLTGKSPPYVVKNEDIGFLRKLRIVLTFPTTACAELFNQWRIGGSIPLPDHTPSTSKYSADSQEWMISFATLDLGSIKNIRRRTNTHFNAVVTTLLVGAVRRLCVQHGKNDLPKHLFITSPTGWPKHPAILKGGTCNHLSLTVTMYPFENGDPLNCLIKGEESYKEKEENGFEVAFHWFILRSAWIIPSWLQAQLLKLSFAKIVDLTLCITPLLLGNEDYDLLGHKVEHLNLPVHLPGIFKAIHLYLIPVSMSNQLEIAVMASNKIFKDQEGLDLFTTEYLSQELQSLKNAVDSKFKLQEI